jgi:hypothetical protein
MCFFAARSRSRGVFAVLGPSSKVIAIYGPSTLTREKVTRDVVGGAVRSVVVAPVTDGGAGVVVETAVAAGGAGEGLDAESGVEAGDWAWAERSERNRINKAERTMISVLAANLTNRGRDCNGRLAVTGSGQ